MELLNFAALALVPSTVVLLAGCGLATFRVARDRARRRRIVRRPVSI